MKETDPSREIESELIEAIKRVSDEGLRIFLANHGPESPEPKEFHGLGHLERMGRRVEKLAEVFRLPLNSREALKMMINWHDAIINFTPTDPNKLLAMISRHRGARKGDLPNGAAGNEGESANGQDKRLTDERIFTSQDRKKFRWAVETTFPEIDFGKNFTDCPFLEQILKRKSSLRDLLRELKVLGIEKGARFSQPHLESYLEKDMDVPCEVLIIGLTDLGAAGMDDEKTFFLEGDAEMRELYGNIRKPKVLSRLINGDEIADQTDRQAVACAFLKWLNDQAGFAMWQYLRFEKIMFLLNQDKKISRKEEREMRSLFNHYEPNIRASIERAKRIKIDFEKLTSEKGEKEAFRYLAKELGYKF